MSLCTAYEPPFAECPGFQKRLQEARVFHIVLENGTSYTKLEGQNPDEILGARILLQVKGLDSLRAVYKKEIPTIDILKAIARSDGKNFKEEWAAILLVDGLQHLLDRDVIIACVTGTVYSPLDSYYNISKQQLIELPVSELYSPYVVLRTETDETRVPVLNEENEIIKLLVSDCGGHGRLLETLYTVRVEAAGKNSAQMHYDILPLSLATSNIDRVVRRTMEIIQNRYCDAIRFNSLEQTAIFRCIFSWRRLMKSENIPGTTLSLEILIGRGLFRFVQDGAEYFGYLETPYSWMLLLENLGKRAACWTKLYKCWICLTTTICCAETTAPFV
ncbi:hypothetical protein BGX38DRAFT_608604 [Terfezia claveryi]|nr:hypothetical protein BGX38DRAFT_608604 [Terfezia claveryi]